MARYDRRNRRTIVLRGIDAVIGAFISMMLRRFLRSDGILGSRAEKRVRQPEDEQECRCLLHLASSCAARCSVSRVHEGAMGFRFEFWATISRTQRSTYHTSL